MVKRLQEVVWHIVSNRELLIVTLESYLTFLNLNLIIWGKNGK